MRLPTKIANAVKQRLKEIPPSVFPGNFNLPVRSGEPLLVAYHNIFNADYLSVKIAIRPLDK
jgi:hypothetical protein